MTANAADFAGAGCGRRYEKELETQTEAAREEIADKQGELAELVGVRRETIIRLEKGLYNPSLKLAMDIAKVFNTTVEEIFSFEE